MTKRRFTIGCGAIAMLAVAGFFPAAASPGTTTTICVGLIIDSHAIGGSVSDRCVNVRAGATGVGVLEAAGHSVTFRRDGLLCTIDGVPSSGCDDIDNTHYWAYFHRAPDATTWSYSNDNMSTYKPVNRSTEGWVYDNGTALTPTNVPAGQMCAGLLKPSRSPAPQPTKTHRAATHPRSPSASPKGSAPRSMPPTSTPTKSHRRHHPASSAAPTASDASATPSIETSPSATAAAGDTAGTSGGGSATGVIAAAAVVAVIAGATVVGARRRRR
ncbi:MAG TPA: hypothetical protein VHA79_06765 [Mycobacteriales bacterium]|nr:hypothetical protein [Mycobacteriales bacterium]HVX69379.1 hypothetical protein [Mycobacteriales bacterium]